MDTAEKKELIINSFKKSFDKVMAYQTACLTEEEIDQLESDPAFQSRMTGLIISEKEKIIANLREFMDCPDDKIAFNATIEYGKILYPEMFKRLTPVANLKVSNKDIDEKEEARIEEELHLLLRKPHVDKPSLDSPTE